MYPPPSRDAWCIRYTPDSAGYHIYYMDAPIIGVWPQFWLAWRPLVDLMRYHGAINT